MPTTVHLPDALLKRVDERAKGLKVSRNQYVRRALERMIELETGWSHELLEALEEAAADEDGRRGVDELVRVISRRSRKRPPSL